MERYQRCIAALSLVFCLLLPSVSVYADPPTPTTMVAIVEALHENCPKIYPELKAQYDSVYRMWSQSNKALLDQVHAMPDYEAVRASLVRGFGEDAGNPEKRRKTCLKGLSIGQPQWSAGLDLSLRYYRHETQVPASQREGFMEGCLMRGVQRGKNPTTVNVFCSCSWRVIASDWTLREWADFREHSDSNSNQFLRIKPKLEQCKAAEANTH